MTAAFVRVAGTADDGGSTVTSLAVTLSGTTANNLLVATVSLKNATSGIGTTPSGWYQMEEHDCSAPSGASGAIYYRIADGFETGVTFSWTASIEAIATVCEYSGVSTSSPLENSGEFTTYSASEQTGGSSISSGTATPATSNGIAIASICGDDERDADNTELSIDNSYAKRSYVVRVAGNNPYACQASKVYTSTAAQSPNWSSSAGTAWYGYGTIGVFKEPAAATASAPPPHKSRRFMQLIQH